MNAVTERLFSARFLLSMNVRRYRLARELSQGKLAELTGLHLNTISSIERGTAAANIDNIELIAKALEVPLIELLREPRDE